MRYAIISDVHSNLEALNAVLAEIDSLAPDVIVCLGDIVGYNSNPNECIAILRGRAIPSVMGNHDDRAAGLDEPDDFNPLAEKALLWTREQLTPENKAYIEALPRSAIIDNAFLAMHGWVNDTDSYLNGTDDAAVNFSLMHELSVGINIAFFGHTHVPVVYVECGETVFAIHEDTVELEKGCSYLINPGSVGQPRNHDPHASFVIYDTEAGVITFHKVDYDIAATALKILEAGLPERLAERLRFGV
ncbi:MAG: metallophosphoesterase family protein [Deltaproteobacteria bacterium]|nr:metallophosphoesterase family protein [Deltaproteobacteria bacterium]